MLLFNLLARWPENKVNYHIVAESDLFKQLFLYCNIQSVLISPFELINWVSFWWNKKEISIFLTLLVDHLHVHTKKWKPVSKFTNWKSISNIFLRPSKKPQAAKKTCQFYDSYNFSFTPWLKPRSDLHC